MEWDQLLINCRREPVSSKQHHVSGTARDTTSRDNFSSFDIQASTEVAGKLRAVGIATVFINSTSYHTDKAPFELDSAHYARAVRLLAKDYVDWHMLTKVCLPNTISNVPYFTKHAA